VFEIPAVQPHQEEASAFGAALVAAQSVGLVDDAAAAARKVGYDPPTQPNPATHDAYRAAFARYRAAVEAHLPLIW
jgi:sugar (pentulose or hexulose) kinase